MRTIHVINPNSTQAVTDGIDAAMRPLRINGGPLIHCTTLKQGPPGVQTQRQVDALGPPLCAEVERLDDADAAAFVIACFSDPGMYGVREATRKPVLGIAECGVLSALTLGQRFGVISILPVSIPRHLRYYAAMGVTDRLAGDLAINLGVLELADTVKTLERMCAIGATLRDKHGADVVVMGCAGMAAFRDRLEQELGIPVVEPTQAAAGMALARTLLA